LENIGTIDDIDIKLANILHHDVEAEIFNHTHPEGASIFECSEVLKSLGNICNASNTEDLCVDIGCGTGFVTSFVSPIYRTVVALDISTRMIEVAQNRLKNFKSLNLLVCDADFLPLKSEVADLVSISSVLHHLPKPFRSLLEFCRILRQDGYLYVTREPNCQRLRRYFAFFDQMIIKQFVKFLSFLPFSESEVVDPNVKIKGLNYEKVDIHYPNGFQISQIAEFLHSRRFEVVSAYSYHWIYPEPSRSLFMQLLSKMNYIVEKMPVSNKLGRYITIIAKKT